MARVAVTGGAGFLGAALVGRLLADGHDVDVVDDFSTGSVARLADARRDAGGRLKIQQLDVADPALVSQWVRRPPEVVFHLAAALDNAASVEHPVSDAAVNTIGALHVIEAMRAARSRKLVNVVAASACYDPVGDDPVQEDEVRRPRTPSASARARFGEVAMRYRDQGVFEFTELVLGNVYGPGQTPGRPGSLVADVLTSLASGSPARVDGPGTQVRDFVFLDDAVDALIRAIERADGAVCHVGTGVGTSVNDVVRAAADVLGVKPLAVSAPARPHSADRIVLDSARAAVRLGWKAWTTLPDGLAATAAEISDATGRT